MARTPFVDDNGIRKGAWSREEDEKLGAYIRRFGHWNWRLLPKFAGLARSGKSCRLRWMNYLKPGVKRGNFSQQEREQTLNLHAKIGNKWSAMALEMPGRTDNEIKNFWYGHIAKRNGKRAIRNEEEVIEPDMFEKLLLECYEVPNAQANISTNHDEQEEPVVSSPDNSTSTAEPITPDSNWTQPFELDTNDTTSCTGEKLDFWTEMPLLETDIYSQAINISSFLEEDLMFFNACYNDFSSFYYPAR